MAYEYRGTQTIASEQERQEQLKAELAKEREAYKEAVRIRKENERLEAEILRTRQRAADLTKPSPTGLPTPIHGGRAGLRRAAAEAAAHDKRKRHAA